MKYYLVMDKKLAIPCANKGKAASLLSVSDSIEDLPTISEAGVSRYFPDFTKLGFAPATVTVTARRNKVNLLTDLQISVRGLKKALK